MADLLRGRLGGPRWSPVSAGAGPRGAAGLGGPEPPRGVRAASPWFENSRCASAASSALGPSPLLGPRVSRMSPARSSRT